MTDFYSSLQLSQLALQARLRELRSKHSLYTSMSTQFNSTQLDLDSYFNSQLISLSLSLALLIGFYLFLSSWETCSQVFDFLSVSINSYFFYEYILNNQKLMQTI